MNILKFIKNIFGIKHNQNTTQTINSTSDKNSITFTLDGFGRSFISINIDNTNQKLCEDFAQMIYNINYGGYEQSILDLIVSLSKEKPKLAPALETILISWGMILATNTEETHLKSAEQSQNRPFIRPRNVFLGSDK